jgi:hypothetical protein
MKLDDEVEKLNKKREKIKGNEVLYVVSDHYILLGKKVIKELGIQNFAKGLGSRQNVSPQARCEVQSTVKLFPARYYRSYKVCLNCFKVYSMLVKEYGKSDQQNKKQKIPDKDPFINYYESEIGIINKDNFNDLLVDIRFYKRLRKGPCNEDLRRQYASMTEYSLNKCLEKPGTRFSSTISSIPSNSNSQITSNFKIRTKKRVLSKVAQFYMGKSLKLL